MKKNLDPEQASKLKELDDKLETLKPIKRIINFQKMGKKQTKELIKDVMKKSQNQGLSGVYYKLLDTNFLRVELTAL